MKKITYFVACAAILSACGNAPEKEAPELSPITKNLRFCESTMWINDSTIYVANFGTEELNPLNTEGKGYIVACKDTLSSIVIPADGNLSAPKGMAHLNNLLYIADVNKVVVYNLSDIAAAPKVVKFPEGDLFLNDVVIVDSVIYITVTNTGRVYSMTPDLLEPVLFAEVPGANGIISAGETLYVASYPADGVTTDANTIYAISGGNVSKLIARPGQYDGLALSEDGKFLYFTNWTGPEVGRVELATKNVELVTVHQPLTGPADLTIKDSVLFVPDLPNSKVVKIKIKQF